MIEILLLLAFIAILSIGGYFIAQQITNEIPFEKVIADQKESLIKREKPLKKVQTTKVVKKIKPKKDDKPKKQQIVRSTKKITESDYTSFQTEDAGLEEQENIYTEENTADYVDGPHLSKENFLLGNSQQPSKDPLKKSKKPLIEANYSSKDTENSNLFPDKTVLDAKDSRKGSQPRKDKPSSPKKAPEQAKLQGLSENVDSQVEQKSPIQMKAKVSSQKPQPQVQQDDSKPLQTVVQGLQGLLPPKKNLPHDLSDNNLPKPQRQASNVSNPSLKQDGGDPSKKTAGQKKQNSKLTPQKESLEKSSSLTEQNNALLDKVEQNRLLEEDSKIRLTIEKAFKAENVTTFTNIPDDVESKQLQKSAQSKKKKKVETVDNSKSSNNLKQSSKSSANSTPSEVPSRSPNQSPTTSKPKKIEVKEVSSNLSNIEEEQMRIVALQKQTDSIEKRKKERKEDRREGKEKMRASLSDDDLSRLMPLIQKSKLNSTEIQEVIETLLNKQQQVNTSSDWVEKGKIDHKKTAERELEETRAKLQEQTDIQSGLSAKISNLRADLNSERAKSTAFKKQLDNAAAHFDQRLITANAAHNEQLKLKINELHTNLDQTFQEKLLQHQQVAKMEIEKNKQHFASIQSELENQLQQYRLAQANYDKEITSTRTTTAEFEQQKQQLQAALADTQTQLQNTAQNREELVQTCQQYQQHLTSLKDKLNQQESAFNSQLGELKSKLTMAESSRTQSLTQYSQIVAEREQMKQKLSKLEDLTDRFSQNQSKLQNALREKGEVEGRLHQSETELCSVRDVIKNQQEQIERLKDEKESLASQSVRPAAEGQENGDIHVEPQQPIVNEHLNMYEEKMSSLTKEITRLKEELSHQKRKNDEAKETRDTESKTLQAFAQRLFPESVVGGNLDQTAFLSQVQTALDKKPGVVEKIAEKIVEDPKLKKMLADLQKENSSLLHKVETLEKEKEKAVLELRKAKHPSPPPAAQSSSSSTQSEEDPKLRLSKLEEENKCLTEKVTHYQEVLGNTESLLKSLQISVENEEAIWRGKLSQSDDCIKELQKENNRLSCELGEIQSINDTSKQAQEMESQLGTLKDKLRKEEDERKSLEVKLQKEQQSKIVLQEQLNNAQEQIKQVVPNANGPANGLEEQESGNSLSGSLVGSESLVSGSSVSESSDPLQAEGKPKKKKKKSIFSKLIG